MTMTMETRDQVTRAFHDAPNDLSGNALALLAVLRGIRGRENAVLARKLAHLIGLRLSGAKRVADAARELRPSLPIGSRSAHWETDTTKQAHRSTQPRRTRTAAKRGSRAAADSRQASFDE